MKFLLDVNLLIAAIWSTHVHHQTADDWVAGKELVSCPVTELGFLRVSTHPKALNAEMRSARRLLESFNAAHRVESIACDLSVLQSQAKNSDAVTDLYLADLAQSKGIKLATLDLRIRHPAVVVVG